jgi:hypothetical protein
MGSPSTVPETDVFLVLDDLGRTAWRETNIEDSDLVTVMSDLLKGQFRNPVRIVGFNTSQGWSQDISEEVAQTVRRLCAENMLEVPEFLEQFVQRYESAKS